ICLHAHDYSRPQLPTWSTPSSSSCLLFPPSPSIHPDTLKLRNQPLSPPSVAVPNSPPPTRPAPPTHPPPAPTPPPPAPPAPPRPGHPSWLPEAWESAAQCAMC
ncbi:unnamed protein product, partial [Closterium sp. NIES-54]